jgi:hypothetical protein
MRRAIMFALLLAACVCKDEPPPVQDLSAGDLMSVDAAPDCVACSQTETMNCSPSRCEKRASGALCCVF